MSIFDDLNFEEGFAIADEDFDDERRRKYFEEHPDEDFWPEDNDEWFGFRGGDWDEE